MSGRLPFAACWFMLSGAVCCASPSARPYTIENYDAVLRADSAQQRLYGEVTLRLRGRSQNAVSAIEMDGGGLKVLSVREGAAPQPFEQNRKAIFVTLLRPIQPDEERTITVQYTAGPAAGLLFSGDQIVASGVSDWMPCDDFPGERATLHLTLTTAPDMKAAASGRLIGTHSEAGQTTSEWRLDSPAEPWRFGFAAGGFSENKSDNLRVLGAGAQIAEPTKAAMQFLAGRTGKNFPGESYTQVFNSAGATGAFAGGFALLPDSKSDDQWLIAYLLAQQWFGIEITPKSWSDLWLSSGVSAFLADGFSDSKFGKEKYEAEIQHARMEYDQLRLEGQDRPLSNPDWNTRKEADNGIPEYKGAWFLYLLSQFAGEKAFDNAFRLFTANEWGQAVTSEDFQRAFETVNEAKPGEGKGASKKKSPAAHGRQVKGLDELFDMWVYGISDAAPRKKSR